jgi:hypothetical protein
MHFRLSLCHRSTVLIFFIIPHPCSPFLVDGLDRFISNTHTSVIDNPIKYTNVVFYVANVPDSIKRVGAVTAFPNEYPGMIHAFNWALNGDGVTPLRESAFRINKSLDLKVAGLELPKIQPLEVKIGR